MKTKRVKFSVNISGMGRKSGGDEIPSRDAVVKKYDGVADRYEKRWEFYVRATTRETVRRINLQPTIRLLDVGCGTGALLWNLSLSHPAGKLAGLDPSSRMLAVARKRLPSEVELKEGWAEDIPFPKESFDIVVSCNMLHYVHHPQAALREFRRVLKPGGRVIITDWCDDYLACRVCDLYLRIFNPSHFRVYREKECYELLRICGFDVIDIERYKISFTWGLMTARARRARP